jgi:hypothetical protein
MQSIYTFRKQEADRLLEIAGIGYAQAEIVQELSQRSIERQWNIVWVVFLSPARR